MKKLIAMIPVLLGSTRVPNKNLILVDGYPLIFYVINAIKKANIFDEIYINSEHEEFEKISKMLKVNFYKREKKYGGSECIMKNKSGDCNGKRCQYHDHYIVDFLKKIKCKYLVQVHTTSPLIKPETIKRFCEILKKGKYDSLFAVENKFNETFYDEKPINFSLNKKTMTQNLKPIQSISWALSGWKSDCFLKSYYRDDKNEAGPTFCGNIGLFPISKIEALDIDTFDDLYIVEACLSHKRKKNNVGKFEFNNRIIEIDKELNQLIHRDGVDNIYSYGMNKKIINIKEIIKKMGPAPWLYQVAYNDTDQACMICQNKYESCRNHYHVTKDEWWIILQGQFEWRLENETILANEGDIVYLPKGTIHTIVCTSNKPGIRLAMGARDMEHIYVK